MALSKQQINVFNTFGYLNFPGLFADSIEKIIEEFEILIKIMIINKDPQLFSSLIRVST